MAFNVLKQKMIQMSVSCFSVIKFTEVVKMFIKRFLVQQSTK